jgi:hypothetical protein
MKDEKEEALELLAIRIEQTKFIEKYSDAMEFEDVEQLATSWQGPKCLLNLNLKNGKLEANGSHTETDENKKSVKYEIYYKGKVSGRGLLCCEISTWKTGDISSKTVRDNVMMLISEGLESISVCDMDAEEKENAFYDLVAVR